jgi:hypothetical protein
MWRSSYAPPGMSIMAPCVLVSTGTATVSPPPLIYCRAQSPCCLGHTGKAFACDAGAEDLCTIAQCIGGHGLAAVCRLLAEDHAGWSGERFSSHNHNSAAYTYHASILQPVRCDGTGRIVEARLLEQWNVLKGESHGRVSPLCGLHLSGPPSQRSHVKLRCDCALPEQAACQTCCCGSRSHGRRSCPR